MKTEIILSAVSGFRFKVSDGIRGEPCLCMSQSGIGSRTTFWSRPWYWPLLLRISQYWWREVFLYFLVDTYKFWPPCKLQPTNLLDMSTIFVDSSLSFRSHILALCCDCEAVDKAADRLFAGQGLSVGLSKWAPQTILSWWYEISFQDSSVGEIITVIEDRLRLPFKGGALKLPLGAH